MLKNNLLFREYTNFTDCLYEFEYMRVARIAYMNWNIQRQIFKFVFVHTKINTYPNENECI